MRVTAAKDGVQGRRRLRIFAAAVALVLLCAVCVGSAGAWSADLEDKSWAENYDTETVFYIDDANDLARLSTLVNSGKDFAGKRVVLNNDIDLSNHQEWVSIGTSTRPFAGTFDGMEHTISGLYQHLAEWNEVGGLFGYVTGTVTGVTLTDSEIAVSKGGVKLGSLVGVLEGGTVNNCKVTNTVKIVSLFDWDDFLGSLWSGIFGTYTIGGVVGVNDGGVVSGYDVHAAVDADLFKSLFGKDLCKYGEIVGDGDPVEADKWFTITAMSDENGLITSPGANPYSAGSSHVFYFTPNVGYGLATVLVDNTDVTSACRETMSYSFADIQKDHTISVTYQLALTYKITIPDELVLSTDTHTGEMKITAEELYIPEAGEVRVTVSSTHDFNLAYVADEDVLLSYQASVVVDGEESVLSAENNAAAAFTMEEFTALSPELPESTMTAEVTGTPIYAGTYQDTLTFTAQYIES